MLILNITLKNHYDYYQHNISIFLIFKKKNNAWNLFENSVSEL